MGKTSPPVGRQVPRVSWPTRRGEQALCVFARNSFFLFHSDKADPYAITSWSAVSSPVRRDGLGDLSAETEDSILLLRRSTILIENDGYKPVRSRGVIFFQNKAYYPQVDQLKVKRAQSVELQLVNYAFKSSVYTKLNEGF